MKNKKINLKGFTLIELLAVIVILAVIALIAVPQILKILNKARLSAAEDSVYGIVKAAESYTSNFMLQNNGTLPSEDLVFNCSSDGCLLENISSLSSYNLTSLDKLDFKGTKPISGTIKISNNGARITTTDLVINNFVCGYIGGKSFCIEKGKTDVKENGTVIYYNPETNKQCNDYVETNSDTGNKTGCMKWYVFNDSEDSVIYNLLLDHNTTATVAWNSSGNNSSMGEVATQLTKDTEKWNSSLNTRMITAKEIATIIGKTNWTNSSSNYFNFETGTTEAPSSYPSPSKYGWLFDRTRNSCKSYGCLNNTTGTNTYGYWTSSFVPEHSNYAWSVYYNGNLYNLNVTTSTYYGIRPVITVSKSNIL